MANRYKKKRVYKTRHKHIAKVYEENKHYIFTGRELNEMLDREYDDATKYATMLMIGEFADDSWTEDKIVEMFGRFSRHDEFVKQGCLTAKDVREIIERKTGMTFERDWF